MGRESRVGAPALGVVASLLAGNVFDPGVARGQTLSVSGTNDAAASAPVVHIYGGLEFLAWWVKAAPLSVPLLATGAHTEFVSGGVLTSSDATILYGSPFAPARGGNNRQTFPGLAGGRLTLGYWLDDARQYAVEGQGFALQSGTESFQANGDASGSPALRVPLYNTEPYRAGGVGVLVPPVEDGVPVDVPGDVTGMVKFKNTLQFWGAAASGVVNFYRDSSLELSGLGGVRYLSLSEGFNLNLNIAGLANSEFVGESGSANDQFTTRNRFYGGSLGLRGKYSFGPVSAELTGRVAFGVDHETLDVSGSFIEFNTPNVTTTPGVVNGIRLVTTGPNGIFAQPSNEGSTSGNKFAIVPEVGIKLAYDITPSLHVSIGYDFLYESNVLRPTDQIDRNFSKGLPFMQDPTSTAGPTRRFKTTDFYAQGVAFGLSYRF